MSSPPVEIPSSPESRPFAFDFKDAMSLMMSLSQRAHNTWSAYAAAALVVSGWLLTRPGALSSQGRAVVIVAVLIGTGLNLFTTLAIYRYFNAVAEETKAAALHFQFRSTGMGKAISELKVISGRTVVVINVVVAALIVTIAVL